MRIAAVGDLHCRADTRRNVAVALRGVDQESDVLLLAGDLTDHGTPEEASWLAEELSQIKMEKCAVLGNHDYWHGLDETRTGMTGAGVVELTSAGVWLARSKSRFRLAGVDDLWRGIQPAI